MQLTIILEIINNKNNYVINIKKQNKITTLVMDFNSSSYYENKNKQNELD